jgi:hypothetical protein
VNVVENYVLMYLNRKMTPVETVTEMNSMNTKENDGGGEFNHDILQELL